MDTMAINNGLKSVTIPLSAIEVIERPLSPDWAWEARIDRAYWSPAECFSRGNTPDEARDSLVARLRAGIYPAVTV